MTRPLKRFEIHLDLPNEPITDSNFRNEVNFSSARLTKRFPLSRCAAAIPIVRPLESIAEITAPTPTGFAQIVGNYLPTSSYVERGSFSSNSLVEALPFFRRERGDDFLEPRIAAEGIPEREQF